MQKFVINIQHFNTITLLLICLLNFHEATPTPTTELPTPAQAADGARCQIPPEIQDVSVTLHPLNTTMPPGSWVEDSNTIHVQCNNRAPISGSASLFCDNGRFNSKFPSCSAYCDGNLLKGLSTVHHCTRDGHSLEQRLCSGKIPPNTEIAVICAAGYKRSNGNERQKIRCLPNGMFDVKREICDLECGVVQPPYEPLRRKRSTAEPNHVPWHVSIYMLENDEYGHVCSGSVVSPTLIISAAHCFWDRQQQLQTPIENYQFIAGKYTTKYNKTGDEMPQIREAKSIEISEDFRGVFSNYGGDIALIKLKEPFIFNDYISAVCMFHSAGGSSDYIEAGTLGSITGYAQNNTLELVPTKTIDFQSCSKDIVELSSDKFCVIVENDNPVCIGGSGDGFVVKNGTRNSLLGILSFTPSNKPKCAFKGIVAGTNVHYIKLDLKRKIKSHLQEDTLLY